MRCRKRAFLAVLLLSLLPLPGFAAEHSRSAGPAGGLELAALWQRLCNAVPVLHQLAELATATAQSDGGGTMDPGGQPSQDGRGTMDPDG